MAASSSPPIEKSEKTLARTIEDMSLTELYGVQRMLEDAKVCSAKLFALALKSLAKLHSEACLERMTKAVEKVGLESCGGEQSYLDIFDMITKLVAATPDDDDGLGWLYRYMQLMVSYTSELADDQAARRASTDNEINRSTCEDSLEVQPHSSEIEVQPKAPELDDQPNAPELEVQPNMPELEVQRHSPGMEFQPHAPEIEDQHNAPEPEVQPDAPELEVQANAPELDVQS